MSEAAVWTLLVQTGSLLGVAMLVGAAWLLGFGTRTRVDAELVRKLVSQVGEPDPLDVALDEQGRAALARTGRDRFVMVRAHGRDPVVRVLTVADVRRVILTRPPGAALVVRVTFADLGLGDIIMQLKQHEPPAFIDQLRRRAA